MKKALTIPLALATSLAMLALPAAAGAEYFIPDGNSAVNQYTEGVPSGGGEKSTKGAGEEPVKPGQTLGVENTEKLEQAGGKEGREAAEVAAETAPPEIVVPGYEQQQQQQQSGGRQSGDGSGQADKGKAKAQPDDVSVNTRDNTLATPASGGDGPSGSGGLGEVLSAATGGSDGGVGLLLPLTIVAAVAWGIGYAWRRRDPDSAATAPR